MKTSSTLCCSAINATVLVLFVVVLGGCSRVETNPIVGKVVFADKPVFPGTVLFKDADGKIHSANLNSEGSFRIPAIPHSNYVVAIQTPDIDFNERTVATAADTTPSDGQPLIREKTIPAKFKNANTRIPGKYRSFATTELSFDFTTEIPHSLVINLD